jgi:hypothetical protein
VLSALIYGYYSCLACELIVLVRSIGVCRSPQTNKYLFLYHNEAHNNNNTLLEVCCSPPPCKHLYPSYHNITHILILGVGHSLPTVSKCSTSRRSSNTANNMVQHLQCTFTPLACGRVIDEYSLNGSSYCYGNTDVCVRTDSTELSLDNLCESLRGAEIAH